MQDSWDQEELERATYEIEDFREMQSLEDMQSLRATYANEYGTAIELLPPLSLRLKKFREDTLKKIPLILREPILDFQRKDLRLLRSTYELNILGGTVSPVEISKELLWFTHDAEVEAEENEEPDERENEGGFYYIREWDCYA